MLGHRKNQRVVNDKLNDDTDFDQLPVRMFYRALVLRNVQAWIWVQRVYREMVLDWLRTHPRREAACRINSEDVYVARTFERLWQATANSQRFECSTLPTVLQYLHASLNSVLLDAMRAVEHPEAACDGERENGRMVWETLLKQVPDVREQRLAYLLYHCGLRPGEIVQRCPCEFSDLREISRLRLNILTRLLHNPGALGQWLEKGQLHA